MLLFIFQKKNFEMENIKKISKLIQRKTVAPSLYLTLDRPIEESLQQLVSLGANSLRHLYDWARATKEFQNQYDFQLIASSSSSSSSLIEEEEKETELPFFSKEKTFETEVWQYASTTLNPIQLENMRNVLSVGKLYRQTRLHLKEPIQEEDKWFIAEWTIYLYMLSELFRLNNKWSVNWRDVLTSFRGSRRITRSEMAGKLNAGNAAERLKLDNAWFTIFTPLFLRDVMSFLEEMSTPILISLTACDHMFGILLAYVFQNLQIISYDYRVAPCLEYAQNHSPLPPNIVFQSGPTFDASLISQRVVVFADLYQMTFDANKFNFPAWWITTLPIDGLESKKLFADDKKRMDKRYVLGENRDRISRGFIYVTKVN